MKVLYDIPEYVKEELEARRNNLQRLQQPKSPWFRFISNAQPGTIETNQEGEDVVNYGEDVKILQGGVFDKGDQTLKGGLFGQYSFERGDAARPEPGVESLDIKIEGSSINITVNWKAWTPNQLNNLAPYFLIPGMSCIIDFGWSTAPGRAAIDVSSLDARRELYQSGPNGEGPYRVDPNQVSEDFIHPSIRYEKRGKAKYGVIHGHIQDFDVSYNEQGGFDVTSTVLGVNEAMLQLRMRNQYQRRESVEDGDEKKPTFYEYVKEFLDKEVKDSLDRGGSGGNIARFGEDNTFISWQYFEEKVINPYISSIHRENNNIKYLYFDSRDSFGSWIPGLLSSDAEKCIVSPSTDSTVAGDFKVSNFKQKPSLSVDNNRPDPNTQDIPANNNRLGYIYNLYVNTSFIKTVAEEEEMFISAIEKILNGCSDACFNVWDFTLEQEGSNIVVIDMNATAEDVNSAITTAYEFFPFTTESVVTDFSFNFDLPKSLTSQMYLGSQTTETKSEQDGIYNNAKGVLQKLFGPDFVRDTTRDLKRSAPFKKQTKGGSQESTQDKQLISPGNFEIQEQYSSGEESSFDRQRGFVPNDLQAYVVAGKAKEALKEKILRDTDKNSPRNAGISLPINVSLSFEGITGLRRFQTFTVANLPNPFNGGVYMVKNVSHSISTNDWTTTVEGNFVSPNPF